VRHPKGHHEVSLYYASVGYTSEPGATLKVPAGGNHALRLPRTEQHDPWDMHPGQLADGTVIGPWPGDQRTALIIPPVTGLAVVTVDAVWVGAWNDGTIRRAYIVGDNQPYEPGYETDGPAFSWTTQMMLTAGEPIVVMLGHTAATQQTLESARVRVVINGDIAKQKARRARVRVGTDPSVPDDPEAPANPGGTTPPVSDDDTIPR
jgi:hypothetical protein